MHLALRILCPLAAILAFLMVVGAPTCASAQVQILDQHVNMEASASARCVGEEPPEPDFEKRWLTTITEVNEDFHVEMGSDCGEARFDDQLSLNYDTDTISGIYGAWSGTNGLAGGYANITAHVEFRVLEPTSYTLTSSCDFLQILSPHIGGSSFRLHGGDVDHDTGDADWWDEAWDGVLQPGSVYRIQMQSSSSRVARELPGGELILNDGSTHQEVVFQLQFDGVVVSAKSSSWGTLKAQY